jgi:2,4-dienoyl-CoA reductase-like NADH-dependent reductase (Old Yellow Enzyme family)
MNLAGWTKKITGLPTITVGSVSLNQDFITAYRTQGTETAANIDRLLEMLARGDFDLVAVGRALIVNPDWPDRIRTGRAATLKPWSPEALATLY